MFWINHLVAPSKHFKGSNLAKNYFELHAWVKKCPFGNFSERAGMAMLVQPSKIGFEKFFLFWVPKDWMAKCLFFYAKMVKNNSVF
jgi:hypothetical protein